MHKKIFWLSLLVTLGILAISYFVPLRTASGQIVNSAYPDQMTSKFYGFPLAFSIANYGGIAGYDGQRQFIPVNFLVDFIIIFSACFLFLKFVLFRKTRTP